MRQIDGICYRGLNIRGFSSGVTQRPPTPSERMPRVCIETMNSMIKLLNPVINAESFKFRHSGLHFLCESRVLFYIGVKQRNKERGL